MTGVLMHSAGQCYHLRSALYKRVACKSGGMAAPCTDCMRADWMCMLLYRMCIPCAKAVCSMPDHAPQCPFCRAAITRLLRIPMAV